MKPALLGKAALWRNALLLIVILITVFLSCRKDHSNSNTSDSTNVDVAVLQSTYAKGINTNTQQKTAAYSMVPQLNLIHSLNVDWASCVITRRKDGSKVVEFRVEDTSRTFMENLQPGQLIKYNDKTSVIFIEKNDTVITSFFMKVVEDLRAPGAKSTIKQLHYGNIPSGYNGTVLFYGLGQTFMNGYRYTNGKITADVSAVIPVSNDGKQIQSAGEKTDVAASAPDCTETDYYQEYCEWGGTADDPYEYFHGCTDTYIGSTIECDDTSDSGGGAASDSGGGGGGGTTTTNQPCNPSTTTVEDIAGGKRVILVAAPPPGGSGGTGTGTTPPPCPTVKQTITDSVKNPCLRSMVQATIGANVTNQINSLIQAIFGSSTTMNLSFIDVNNLPPNVDGNTNINGGITNGILNVQVQLDNTHLPSYSQQYIARVIMHEALHAYLTAIGTSEDQQHESMMVNYVTQMATSLQQMFPGLSDTDAKNLALGGLQVSPTFQSTIENDMNLSGTFTAVNLAYSVGSSGLRCTGATN